MPDYRLTAQDIPMRKGELLMVFWHEQNREWWATVSPKKGNTVKAGGEGSTPVAALANLLVELGSGTVEGTH